MFENARILNSFKGMKGMLGLEEAALVSYKSGR